MTAHTITIVKTRVQNYIKISATISTTQKEFWVMIPAQYEDCLTQLSDPWLNILVFPMMETGGTFNINGSVSKSLLDNIEMFANIWTIWCPNKYKPIRIMPENVSDTPCLKNNKLICAFSGGLDAAYTAYKYKNHLNGLQSYDLDAAIMLHGADIPLTEPQQFENSFKYAKNMTDDLGINLIPVKTNYREHTNNWSFEFGSVISGVLSLFSKKYSAGVMASDDSFYHFELPWGLNPISDWYLKSDSFNFIVDGYQHTRTDRATFVSSWKACIDNLRVCWRNEDKSKNCGKCEKCIRTKLNFMAVGLDHLPTMPNDLTTQELLNEHLIHTNHNIIYFEEILDYANKNKTLDVYWFNLLKSQIKTWKKLLPPQKKHHSFWWHLWHMKF